MIVMSVRRVGMALILLTPAFVIAGSIDPVRLLLSRNGWYMLAVCTVTLGTAAVVPLGLLAAVTGWKTLTPRGAAASGRANVGYRAAWAVGALLLLPLLYPAYVLASVLVVLWLAGPPARIRVEDVTPFGIDPLGMLAIAGLSGVIGLLLSIAEPPGHLSPVTVPAVATQQDAEYAERLARKKAETTELIRSFEARADAFERDGNREQAAGVLEQLVERLGHVHPEAERLRTRIAGLRR
jgi:hypothetical protein